MVHLPAKGFARTRDDVANGGEWLAGKDTPMPFPFSKYYAEMCLHGFGREYSPKVLIAFMPDLAVLFLACFSNFLINTPYGIGWYCIQTEMSLIMVLLKWLACRYWSEALNEPFPKDVCKLLIEKFKLINLGIWNSKNY